MNHACNSLSSVCRNATRVPCARASGTCPCFSKSTGTKNHQETMTLLSSWNSIAFINLEEAILSYGLYFVRNKLMTSHPGPVLRAKNSFYFPREVLFLDV